MIRAVISTSDADERGQAWLTVYENGVERGRLGLSHAGTEEVTSALRNAQIDVTDLTAAPDEDDGTNDV